MNNCEGRAAIDQNSKTLKFSCQGYDRSRIRFLATKVAVIVAADAFVTISAATAVALEAIAGPVSQVALLVPLDTQCTSTSSSLNMQSLL